MARIRYSVFIRGIRGIFYCTRHGITVSHGRVKMLWVNQSSRFSLGERLKVRRTSFGDDAAIGERAVRFSALQSVKRACGGGS